MARDPGRGRAPDFPRAAAAGAGGAAGVSGEPRARPVLRGRGTAENPPGRFERIALVPDGETLDADLLALGELPSPRTLYLRDSSRSIIAYNDSPDIPFDASINPYRGCEHGCAYCYARPFHEYLGFSAGLDFETRIVVKPDAALLLRRELRSASWRPQPIIVSGVTDAYQPIERRLRLTRACLEVLAEARNPVSIITKNHLVTRDADVLRQLAGCAAGQVNLSITSLRPEVQRVLEPRTSIPARRLDAIARLTDAGVPVGVMVAPVIPGLTDEELPAILGAARAAGARWASYAVLRLPYAVAGIFQNWVEQHFPERAGKVLNRIRAMRGGKLYDANWRQRMHARGEMANQLRLLFRVSCRQLGFDRTARPPLSIDHFHPPGDPLQPSLFD
ncbi:MAG: PA0069 family radical SAM protein [Gemmatimonadetes bacterium]|nr:PA0069 family radical SAM protein [Gemmatimonadota bacterium]